MGEKFPSRAFFDALRARIEAERARFARLGLFDARFGVHVLGDATHPERLVVLEFDAYACKSIREVAAQSPPPQLDFVLEAPYAVWREMLTSTDGEAVDGAHTINTLTHHGEPMRVVSVDPDGHDKLFRFQESVQLVFDVASAIETMR